MQIWGGRLGELSVICFCLKFQFSFSLLGVSAWLNRIAPVAFWTHQHAESFSL